MINFIRMTVEEYFEEWWTPKELPENGFNKTAMLDFAEMYHNKALRIHDVSNSAEYTSGYKDGWRDCCKDVKEFE